MPTNWIKCTSLEGDLVYVNIDLVRLLKPVGEGSGSRIEFGSGHVDHVKVKDSPEEILQKLNELKNASGI